MAENNNDLMNTADELNTVSGVENVTKKKGGKKAAAIGIGAAAVIAGGSIAAYNLSDLVKNQVKLRLMKPENYYAWVNEENAKTAAEQAAESYREYLDKMDEGQSASFKLRYEISDAVKDLLKEDMDGDEAEVLGDIIDNAENIELGVNANAADGGASGKYFLNYNDEKLTDLEFAADTENMDVFFRIPDMSEQWIYMAMGEAMEGSYYGDEEIIEAYKSFLKDPESFLSPEELQDLIERYTAVWNDCIDDVELEKSEDVDIADITVKYTAITLELDQEKFEEIAEAFIEEAKDDDIIKGIVVDKLQACDEDEFDEALDSMLEDLEHEADYEYSDEVLELTTYVDAKGTIRGYAAEMGDDFAFNFVIGKDGDDVRGTMSAESDGEQVFTGELVAEKKGDSYEGDFGMTFTDSSYDWETEEYTDEEKNFSVEFDSVQIVNEERGYFNGNFTFSFPDVDPFTVEFTADEDSQSVAADLNIDGTDYGRVSATLGYEDGGDAEVPSKDGAFQIDPEDTDLSIEDYITQEDFEAYLSDIFKKLGLNDDYAKELAAAAGDDIYYTGYTSGSYDDYDDDWDVDDDDTGISTTSATDPYEKDKVEAADDQAYLYVYDDSYYASYSGWSGSLSYKATVADITGDGTYTVGVNADSDGYREYTGDKKPKGIDELRISMYTDKYDMTDAQITVKSIKIDGKEIEIKGEPVVDSYSYYLDASLVTSDYYDDEEAADLLGGILEDKEWTSIEVTFELKGVKEG